MKKICFITGTRADYGIMSNLMRKIKLSKDAAIQIIATNMHLSENFGETVNEIEKDGFIIDKKVISAPQGDNQVDISRSMAFTLSGVAESLNELRPDIVVILGDRYEALAAACAANIMNIPVAHLHGGETTKGAIDDNFRHAITKLASLHFASTQTYSDKIISMGENPDNVFNMGALGVENILNSELLSLKQFEDYLNFDLGNKYFVITFHPTTKSYGEEEFQIKTIIKALDHFKNQGWKFLITLPNSDPGNKTIRKLFKEYEKNNSLNVKTVESLGRIRYFTALKYSKAVIGNSSSGLIEAPSFYIPTINIGNRQEGRVMGPSVINSEIDNADIIKKINYALNSDFIFYLRGLDMEQINPYYKNDTSNLIMKELLLYLQNNQ